MKKSIHETFLLYVYKEAIYNFTLTKTLSVAPAK